MAVWIFLAQYNAVSNAFYGSSLNTSPKYNRGDGAVSLSVYGRSDPSEPEASPRFSP